MFEKELRKLEEKEISETTPVVANLNIGLLKMKTILAEEISKDQLESIIEKAMLESINSKTVLLLNDDKNIVEMSFINGTLEDIKGDVNQLSNQIKVILKKSS